MQAKAKIMVVRDIERDDIEYISKTLNCLPIAHVDHMKPEKLGHADRVDEVQVYLHVHLMMLLSITCSGVTVYFIDVAVNHKLWRDCSTL